jgi:hypothetical protein
MKEPKRELGAECSEDPKTPRKMRFNLRSLLFVMVVFGVCFAILRNQGPAGIVIAFLLATCASALVLLLYASRGKEAVAILYVGTGAALGALFGFGCVGDAIFGMAFGPHTTNTLVTEVPQMIAQVVTGVLGAVTGGFIGSVMLRLEPKSKDESRP